MELLDRVVILASLEYRLAGKESTCDAGDPSLIPGLRRSPGERIGWLPTPLSFGFPCGSNLQGGRSGFNPWVGKIPQRRAWQPTAGFLPGESPWTEEPGGL